MNPVDSWHFGDAMPARSIRIGGCGKPELLGRLEAIGVRFNPLAQDLFRNPRFTTEPVARQVEVLVVTAAALGLPAGGTYTEIVEAAAARRLCTGPLELGPQLRLQWLEQAESAAEEPPRKHRAPPGSVTVASWPPADDEDLPWGFYLRRMGGEPWLRGYRSWSGHAWSADDAFAFLRARDAA